MGVVGAGDVNPRGLPEADIGMSQAQLAALWGPPDYYDNDIHVAHWEALDVLALSDPVRYFLVGAENPANDGVWVTPSGARLGMPEQDLRALYGDQLTQVPAARPQLSTFNSSHHYYIATPSGRGLGFAIHNGKVEQLLAAPAEWIEGITADAGTAIP